MKVLITGDREYEDEFIVYVILNGLYVAAMDVFEDLIIIEGGARGADDIARRWGENLTGVHHETVKAEWRKHGKAAGPIRNRKMFDEYDPDVVIAFHDDLSNSKGTKDMANYAMSKGATVYLMSRHELG